MSGVCYSGKDSRVDGLQVKDYENMVVTAEKKCTLLKRQLDSMKSFCNQSTPKGQNTTTVTTATTTRQSYGSSAKLMSGSRIRSFVEDPGNKRSEQGVAFGQKAESGFHSPVKRTMPRQNSHKITTDHSGGVYGTINTMIAGLTEAIVEPVPEVRNKNQIQGVENVKINSKVGQDNQGASGETAASKRANRFKLKCKKSTSSHRLLKRARRSALKVGGSTKLASEVSAEVQNPTRTQSRSQYQMTNFETIKSVPVKRKSNGPIRRPTNHFQADSTVSKRKTPLAMLNKTINKNLNKDVKCLPHRRTKDLVEIYHNIAVKESHSSDLADAKNKPAKKENYGVVDVSDIVPPLAIRANNHRRAGVESATKFELGAMSRNYQAPTISSRMKQVAKYYMNTYSFRAIPFCPVGSTSPSHNIGLNIQQVMNMVKTRQPSQNLPPTLAYNIGLAADKWNNGGEGGLSYLVSQMTSRVFSQCPLSRSVMNYQQLQEAAKVIPEETIEECDESVDMDDFKSPDTQSMFITGPSGDVKVTTRKATMWSGDPNHKKCSCAPQRGVELDHVASRIASVTSQLAGVKRPASVSAKVKRKPSGMPTLCTSHKVSMEPKGTPGKGKEHKLKMVLNKLHDEFKSMNEKYEDLLEKNNSAPQHGANKDTNQQLEVLDKELSQKEEEIVMVMNLFNEVLALKQQVKSLKERNSKEVLSVKSQASRMSGYNRATTAGVLNKLLRQVQHFSNHYKQ